MMGSMKTKTTVIAGMMLIMAMPINAEEGTVRGSGNASCSEYIKVVDGNWSHPLNALHFHGYISWAQGMISGYNKYSGKDPVLLNTDEIKLALVDYCRANPEVTFAEAASVLIEQ